MLDLAPLKHIIAECKSEYIAQFASDAIEGLASGQSLKLFFCRPLWLLVPFLLMKKKKDGKDACSTSLMH